MACYPPIYTLGNNKHKKNPTFLSLLDWKLHISNNIQYTTIH